MVLFLPEPLLGRSRTRLIKRNSSLPISEAEEGPLFPLASLYRIVSKAIFQVPNLFFPPLTIILVKLRMNRTYVPLLAQNLLEGTSPTHIIKLAY